MEKSKSLAGIVGPSLTLMVISELKLWNPTLYAEQIVPLIYLSGVLLFIAGLAIIRKHNVWVMGWQTILTVLGWAGMFLGVLRMFFPHMYKAQFKNEETALSFEIILILIGLSLTVKAYFPLRKK